MYTSIALISSVAALALSNPLPAAPRRHRIQAQNLNLNPNMGDQKIVDGSLGSKYRPDLSDSEYIDFKNPNNAKKGAIRNGQAQHDIEAAAEGVNVDDVPNQNQIMNEISNIIQQNNIRVRKLKVAPAAVNEQEPLDLAVPIVNEQDPNNGEQFEKLPRVNERIPVVNGIANDNEGIVYNEPKVHERVPINKQVDLEDTRNIDAVINKLAQHMNDNKMSENKMAAKNLIHHDHHHHLHRGADMADKVEKIA